MRLQRLAPRLIAAVLAAGCSPPSTAPVAATPPASPAAPAPAAVPAGLVPFDSALATATIVVRARVVGEPPRRRPIKMDQDAECMKLHTEPALEETVVCDDGLLANVIVWVSRGAERWSYDPVTAPSSLELVKCMFAPHAFTLGAGQPLEIRQRERAGCGHFASWPRKNPHVQGEAKSESPPAVIRFPNEEAGIRIKSEHLGWAYAVFGVFAHPFHGVTDRDGRIALRVPPGDYEVSVWHEYDRFTKPAPRAVTVADNGTVEVEFEFATAPR